MVLYTNTFFSFLFNFSLQHFYFHFIENVELPIENMNTPIDEMETPKKKPNIGIKIFTLIFLHYHFLFSSYCIPNQIQM